MSAIPQPDLIGPDFTADPFPFFARLRAEEPVYRAALRDGTPAWLVTRSRNVRDLLRDDRFVKSRDNALTPEQLRKHPWMPPMFRVDRKSGPGHTLSGRTECRSSK